MSGSVARQKAAELRTDGKKPIVTKPAGLPIPHSRDCKNTSNPAKPRTTPTSPDELPGLIRAIAAYPHAHDACIGLRVLSFFVVRPSEAKWSEFDFAKKVWTIPVERKGRKKGFEYLVPIKALEGLTMPSRLGLVGLGK